jgi:hypothetical protein
MDYPGEFPLLFRRRWPHRSMADDIAAIDVRQICEEYESLRSAAPKRSPELLYFVGHDGIPTTSSASNRREEHIAIALANLDQSWSLNGVGEFDFLDYQVPLKSRQADKGVGKVDLLGRTNDGRLLIIELKVMGHSGGRSDPPIAALFEALRYTSILEANLAALDADLRSTSAASLSSTEKPIVLVLGENAWWESWRGQPGAQKVTAALDRLVSQVTHRLGVTICFAEAIDLSLQYGGSGKAPSFLSTPRLREIKFHGSGVAAP